MIPRRLFDDFRLMQTSTTPCKKRVKFSIIQVITDILCSKRVQIRYGVIYKTTRIHSARLLAVSSEIYYTERNALALLSVGGSKYGILTISRIFKQF